MSSTNFAYPPWFLYIGDDVYFSNTEPVVNGNTVSWVDPDEGPCDCETTDEVKYVKSKELQ